jgi:hypothetical protein
MRQEIGPLALQMLKNFCGRQSYANCCSKVVLPPSVLGTSGGGDGVKGSSHWDGGGGKGFSLQAPMERR